ncbi:acyl carrier protein [Streptomyces sp. R11]|uniref:Acyl carrier protein n=1 Tax=Streptomyces sp. R11 TaxID=3238625 RepID=A0AB39NCH8_9ACTN
MTNTTTVDDFTASFLAVLDHFYRNSKNSSRLIRMEDRIAEDLEFDSLAALELLVTLEERWNVTLVGTADVVEIVTVADLHDLLLRSFESEDPPETLFISGELMQQFNVRASCRRTLE